MNIVEALTYATEIGSIAIYRAAWHSAAVDITLHSSHEHLNGMLVYVSEDGVKEFQPTLDDLMADDWCAIRP